MDSKVIQEVFPSCSRGLFLKMLQGSGILRRSHKTSSSSDGYRVLDKIGTPFSYSGKNVEDFTIFPTIRNRR